MECWYRIGSPRWPRQVVLWKSGKTVLSVKYQWNRLMLALSEQRKRPSRQHHSGPVELCSRFRAELSKVFNR
jgi:hypothetical protein